MGIHGLGKTEYQKGVVQKDQSSHYNRTTRQQTLK